MRKPGNQTRILLTNVKQLELLLTRQQDLELAPDGLDEPGGHRGVPRRGAPHRVEHAVDQLHAQQGLRLLELTGLHDAEAVLTPPHLHGASIARGRRPR